MARILRGGNDRWLTKGGGSGPRAVRPARPARWSAAAREIFRDEEGVDASAWIEGGGSCDARINDGADTGDGQGGFCDVGGNDDFWSVGCANCFFLIGGGEGRVEGKDVVGFGGGEVFQKLNGAADFVGAGEENQDVSGIGEREGFTG